MYINLEELCESLCLPLFDMLLYLIEIWSLKKKLPVKSLFQHSRRINWVFKKKNIKTFGNQLLIPFSFAGTL